MTDRKKDPIIEETTNQLRGIVQPYLGRKDFGNLRIVPDKDQFPRDPYGLGHLQWEVFFESFGCSTSSISITYDHSSGSWGVSPEIPKGVFNLYGSRETAIRAFEEKVQEIPLIRREIIIQRGGDLEKTLRPGVSLRDVYSDEEIRLIEEMNRIQH